MTGNPGRNPSPCVTAHTFTVLTYSSTSRNPESKTYAFEAGARAIKAHFERLGIGVESVEKGIDYGIYHTRFALETTPLVSVIIPNKDHQKDLETCLTSLLDKGTYKNLEVIVVEITAPIRKPSDTMRNFKSGEARLRL